MSQKRKIAGKRRSRIAAPVLKRKGKPRGRSFQPGNTFGKATRFAKGTSGNPGGRPGSKIISEALRWMLATPLNEPIMPTTRAEQLALGLIREGLRRRLGFVSEIADRVEGRPSISLHVDEHDPLEELLKGVNEISARIGPPKNEEVAE